MEERIVAQEAAVGILQRELGELQHKFKKFQDDVMKNLDDMPAIIAGMFVVHEHRTSARVYNSRVSMSDDIIRMMPSHSNASPDTLGLVVPRTYGEYLALSGADINLLLVFYLGVPPEDPEAVVENRKRLSIHLGLPY